MTGSDPAGYDSGDLYHNILVTWIDISKLFILFHVMYIKAFTESKVRNVVDIWEDEYKTGSLISGHILSLRTLLNETYFCYHKSYNWYVHNHKIYVLCNNTIKYVYCMYQLKRLKQKGQKN